MDEDVLHLPWASLEALRSDPMFLRLVSRLRSWGFAARRQRLAQENLAMTSLCLGFDGGFWRSLDMPEICGSRARC